MLPDGFLVRFFLAGHETNLYITPSHQGGVILVSHDEHLIEMACQEVWLCRDQTVHRLEGGLQQYKVAIEAELAASRTN